MSVSVRGECLGEGGSEGGCSVCGVIRVSVQHVSV